MNQSHLLFDAETGELLDAGHPAPIEPKREEKNSAPSDRTIALARILHGFAEIFRTGFPPVSE